MNLRTPFKTFETFVVVCLIIQEYQGQKITKKGIGRGLVHNLHYLDPPGGFDVSVSKDEWFTQRLDHFNAQNTKVWKQRYFAR